MSNPKYVNIGAPETRVVEECAELIHACGTLIQSLCKVDRFGWTNHHPDRPETTNLDEVIGEAEKVKWEMDDVVEACERLEVSMRQMKYWFSERERKRKEKEEEERRNKQKQEEGQGIAGLNPYEPLAIHLWSKMIRMGLSRKGWEGE